MSRIVLGLVLAGMACMFLACVADGPQVVSGPVGLEAGGLLAKPGNGGGGGKGGGSVEYSLDGGLRTEDGAGALATDLGKLVADNNKKLELNQGLTQGAATKIRVNLQNTAAATGDARFVSGLTDFSATTLSVKVDKRKLDENSDGHRIGIQHLGNPPFSLLVGVQNKSCCSGEQGPSVSEGPAGTYTFTGGSGGTITLTDEATNARDTYSLDAGDSIEVTVISP